MSSKLPPEIQQALEPLAPALAAAQLIPVAWERSESFGDFAVTFRNSVQEFMLTRDRGQFIIHGSDRAYLESSGLWQAFDTLQEMEPRLVSWLGQRDGP